MKETSSKFKGILLALCELLVAIILFINPSAFANGILILVGVLFLLIGVIYILYYFKMNPAEAALEQQFSHGLIALFIGGFCILKRNWILAAFPLLTALYGILMLGTAAAKIQWAIDMFRLKAKKWKFILASVGAVITLACAIIILCNPFTSTAVLWNFIAITLVIQAVLDVAASIFSKNANAPLHTAETYTEETHTTENEDLSDTQI